MSGSGEIPRFARNDNVLRFVEISLLASIFVTTLIARDADYENVSTRAVFALFSCRFELRYDGLKFELDTAERLFTRQKIPHVKMRVYKTGQACGENTSAVTRLKGGGFWAGIGRLAGLGVGRLFPGLGRLRLLFLAL